VVCTKDMVLEQSQRVRSGVDNQTIAYERRAYVDAHTSVKPFGAYRDLVGVETWFRGDVLPLGARRGPGWSRC
jgi:hypothetical protein